MALPEIKVRVTADTTDATTGLDRVEDSLQDVGTAADRAKTKMGKLDAPMSTVTRSSGRMRSAVQNASFQLADMAVMMEMGIDTSRVMAQQLPQLVGGFGAFGAALGAVIAIGIPLATTMKSMSANGQDMMSVFGTLEPVMRSVGDAMSTVADIAVDFGELVVNNIDRILITAATAATFFAGKWVAGFIAAKAATMTLSGALLVLRSTLIRLGFTAIIVAAGEVIYQFTRLVKAAGTFGSAMGLLADVSKEAWDRIKAGGDYLVASLAITWNEMQFTWSSVLSNMAVQWGTFVDGIAGTKIGEMLGIEGGNADAALAQMAEIQNGLTDALIPLLDAQSAAAGAMSGPFESIQKIRDLLAGMKDEGITLGGVLGLDEDGEGGSSLDEKLTEQEERIAEHLDRIKALTEGTLSDKLGAWGDYFNGLVSLTGSSNDKLLAMAQAAGAAQALIDAWRAHNATLADPTLPWWARIASAANVLAAGIGAVNAIKSVSSSGSGTTSTSTSSASTSSSVASASAASVNIDLTGTLDKTQLQSLTEQLNSEYEDGYRLNFV